MTDFILFDHGSVTTLRPETDEALAWLNENIAEPSTWFGRALVIEPRYVEPILDGIERDGLTVDHPGGV